MRKKTWGEFPAASQKRALARITILAVAEAALLSDGGAISAAVEIARAASVFISGKTVCDKSIRRWRARIAHEGFFAAPDVAFVDGNAGIPHKRRQGAKAQTAEASTRT